MRMSKRADPHGLRSKHRSALRLCLGTAYYSAQRYLLWMSGKYRFASQRQKDRLPCVHMAHHTPLLRKLKDVEMQYQHNKITNLKLAVARLDGIVVQPGETLSYWKLIGRPHLPEGVSGRCAAEKRDRAVRMRRGAVSAVQSHLLDDPAHPAGGEGASPPWLRRLSRLQPDPALWERSHLLLSLRETLMIYNPTDRPFQLCLRVGETDLEGEWRSDRPPQFRYQIVERHHEMRHEWWGGCSRHNELYLQVFDLEGEARWRTGWWWRTTR